MGNRRIEHTEGELRLVFEITDEEAVKLLHFAPFPYETEQLDNKSYANRRAVEVHCTGENGFIHHGMKHVGTLPGGRLRYRSHELFKLDGGSRLSITQLDEKTAMTVISHYRFYDELPLAKCWTELKNEGSEELPIEYVSSFAYNGLAKEGSKSWDDKMRLHIPRNSWCGEVQWRDHSLPEWGLSRVFHHSVNRLSISSQGTWSSYEHMPMAVLENTEAGSCLFWQIEHNGSWHWEVSDAEVNQLYIRLSGPTENESHWTKMLQRGETFQSVPVVVGSIRGGFTEAAQQLTGYLRHVRRPAEDNRKLPVIFNDFMHALWGNPTTEKLVPFVDAAADSGCEIFCIDAGWYKDGLGEWLPAHERFEGGLGAMISYIKSKGMVPGLWLELESVDTISPLAESADDDWFFRKRGKRVVDAGRYQLDFRHPDVRRHADETVDRLVKEFGIGYFKFDYNQNAGIGTDANADSAGEGLLGHNRAYLAWVDRLFKRHPDLIVEACASGGMRMDYATLSRFSLQSVSDQMDYRLMGMIAAASPSLVPPEQAGVWAYPLKDSDDEAVIFNMVNVIPFRIILGGQLHEVSESGREYVREAIRYYKTVRDFLPEALAYWPLGITTVYSDWTCLLLVKDNRMLLAVWRLDSDHEEKAIPLSMLQGKDISFTCAYPAAATGTIDHWESESGVLTVRLPQSYSARIIEIAF
jgi:Alpha-galactosidase